MTRPQKYLTRITLFLIPVTILCVFLYPRLHGAFATNPGLNGLITAVLFLGIILSIRQITMLNPAVNWIENFRKNDSAEMPTDTPQIIAPMVAMMGQNDRNLSLSTGSMRTILDGIAARMDEGREMTRYFIGLLIFLGLLGTFWGLLGTIGSIKDTINNLNVSSNDISTMFDSLKDGLTAPLSGMGTAFSSSLFGLAGSVVLGFIDLQAGQAQGRFFNDLEDWLLGIAKLSRGGPIALRAGDALGEGGEGSVPAYVSALLEQSADSLESLHNVIASSEEKRGVVNTAMLDLSERLSTLSDSQTEMRMVLKQMLELFANQLSGEGEKMQVKYLRNIDVQFKYLTEETVKNQHLINDTLKSEFKLLARTLGAKVDRAARADNPQTQQTVENTPAPDSLSGTRASDNQMDYDMPTPKPKSDKKPVITMGKKLTARKDD